jgi:hypothetical protein
VLGAGGSLALLEWAEEFVQMRMVNNDSLRVLLVQN